MSERTVCVVLHDVATRTRPACERALAAIADVAPLPVTLLAVPRYHGDASSAEFEAWLSERSLCGDELALHGHTHQDDSAAAAGWVDRLRRSHYTRGEGEFWALTQADARARMDFGIDWFGRHGWPLHGFVAPAWLLGPGGWAALEGGGFDYTATLRQIVRLPSKEAITSQSVVYSTSSRWRRVASLGWNALVARAQQDQALLRIELHPRDADFPAIRRSWQRILERALRDRRAATVADAVADQPAGDDAGRR